MALSCSGVSLSILVIALILGRRANTNGPATENHGLPRLGFCRVRAALATALAEQAVARHDPRQAESPLPKVVMPVKADKLPVHRLWRLKPHCQFSEVQVGCIYNDRLAPCQRRLLRNGEFPYLLRRPNRAVRAQ